MDQTEQADEESAPVYAPSVPQLYADGVSQLLPASQVLKFHLIRYDGPVYGEGDLRMAAVAQVAMPVDGFVHTVVFFERVLKNLIRDGHVTEELVSRLRSALNDVPAASTN
jgi:hypothetical protein